MDGVIAFPQGQTVLPSDVVSEDVEHMPPEDRLTVPERGMPPEHPGDMPTQSLWRFQRRNRRRFEDPRRSRSPIGRRIAVLGGALLLAGLAVYEMEQVLSVGGLTPIEIAVLVLFALNFGWIALAFTSAIAGYGIVIGRLDRPKRVAPGPLGSRTAMLMPTYNEDPARVFAAVEAMAAGLDSLRQGPAFDWFILSDTTDPDVALAEEAALIGIRERLGSRARIYYRRRRKNVSRKAGNVADFCTRWASGYDHLLVLDADSLIAPETIVELARRMEEDPDAGLIQTIPALVNGTTIVARLQQFAGRVYGPIVGSGLAFWTSAEGNYWGHNAIIRTKAFLASAGLPNLPGKPPFGGHILSHDFVEAALLRRAGWTVRIADDLAGSYEESPPSIIDLAIRDRRWCQGNLQHLFVLPARGLNWVSRIHLLTGIGSYLASPLWLLLILAGLALSLQAHFIRPEYFTEEFQLFPTWPVIDAERALRLFALTLAILFGPKIMGLIAFLRDREARRTVGGFKTILSFFFEIFVSALIAPIMMLVHTGAIISILLGRDSGWKPQRRDDGGVPIRSLIVRHRWHFLVGVALLFAASLDSLVLVAWLSPALLGLLLAVPVSGLTGSTKVGRFIRRLGLLRTPEEVDPPAVALAAQAARPAYDEMIARHPSLAVLAADPEKRAIHLSLVDRVPARPPGMIEAVEALSAAKIDDARTISEAVSFMTPQERAMVIATPSLLDRLASLPSA
ncbi:glucans biosynthesis glucosyltransferase MdoH [Kaistia dalseonensis]|uniref:Glucans biosynthesis glucosyltransferase H n=1 Tax=Kaistia dalseonensis TaxID=410840 RepID=A0ABU0H4A6_9HYPH|nr:glucans biosynthesis glucosyltransferase MdoH [Kaistia dalseonensis]MCX5494551.1 glucans biosynthesis glucosyltransferase MdoH [Kaistia dalseonensis]MDQ0437131.1 membrane glycosyltransferase [Kaistia dalseonensis]